MIGRNGEIGANVAISHAYIGDRRHPAGGQINQPSLDLPPVARITLSAIGPRHCAGRCRDRRGRPSTAAPGDTVIGRQQTR
jgi:hypothetical protein